MRRFVIPLILFAGLGCSPPPDVEEFVEESECSYPEDPVHPMEVGAAMFPYAWDRAVNLADAAEAALALADVPCAGSEDIDWSPFDVLLFVSVPAW